MRWAFWRRARSEHQPEALPASAWSPPEARALRPPSRPDETDEQRRPKPAFSGASPEPGRDVLDLLAEGAGDLSGLLRVASVNPSLDISGIRADVVALVEAALARDPAAVAETLRRLNARGADELGMTSIAALAALGDRCAAAAGVPSDVFVRDRSAWAEVVAQGDTVAGRAEPLLRAVVPHASRDLVRSVVRLACGVPEQEPGLAHLMDAPPEDLALIAAALLAQMVLDGQGDTAALAEELAALLPG